MRAIKGIVIDDPTGEHEGESRDELLIRERENQSIQNIASKPAPLNPLGIMVLAEQAIHLLRQERRIGH